MKEKIYTVLVREVHVAHVTVTATSPQEAAEKVIDGEGDYVSLEYSHTLDPDTWSVEDKEGKVTYF